jgi:hypothetical protein
VSDDYNSNLGDALNQEQQEIPFSESSESWERQLQLRANELVLQRTNQLKADFERLQATINDITEQIFEGIHAVPSPQETQGLLGYVQQWFNASAAKAEDEFNMRLEAARTEAAAEAREEAEAEFQEVLKKAARDWDNAQKLANEAETQKRFEELRDQTIASLRIEVEKEFEQRLSGNQTWQSLQPGIDGQLPADEAELNQRLEQACAEAAAVARRESEAQLEELREQLEASRKALTLAVSESNSTADTGGVDLMKSAVDEIDQQRSQSETLATLVKRAADFAPRLVFFVLRGGEAVGWRAKGFDNGLNDDTVRQLTVPTQNPGLLHDALTNFSTMIRRSSSPGDGSPVLGSYGNPSPEFSLAVPLVVRGKAAAVLYADSGTHAENSVKLHVIETLMRVAGMAVELLPARRGTEPARTGVAAPAPAPAASVTAPMPVRPSIPVSTPVTAPIPQSAATALVSPPVAPPESIIEKIEKPAEPPKLLEKDIEQAKRLAQSAMEAPPFAKPEWAARVRTTEELIKPRQIPESWAEPDDRRPAPLNEAPAFANPTNRSESGASRSGLPAKAEEPKSKAVEESAGVSSFSQTSGQSTSQPPVFSSVPTPASETEQRAHNDARRFARLLVSEIKLYNATKVNEGRRNFDLYDRLREEIDRSRKVYDKRVLPSVASRFDYFYDELVQTLAEGDPAKLGPNSPGPVVVAAQ